MIQHAKRSLCWLHMSEEGKALDDAYNYRTMKMDLSDFYYEDPGTLWSSWSKFVVFFCISVMAYCLGLRWRKITSDDEVGMTLHIELEKKAAVT